METSSDSLPLGQCLSWLLLAGFSLLKRFFLLSARSAQLPAVGMLLIDLRLMEFIQNYAVDTLNIIK